MADGKIQVAFLALVSPTKLDFFALRRLERRWISPRRRPRATPDATSAAAARRSFILQASAPKFAARRLKHMRRQHLNANQVDDSTEPTDSKIDNCHLCRCEKLSCCTNASCIYLQKRFLFLSTLEETVALPLFLVNRERLVSVSRVPCRVC